MSDYWSATETDAGHAERARVGRHDEDAPSASDLAAEEAGIGLVRPSRNPAGSPSPLCNADVHWDGTRVCICCPRSCGGFVVVDLFVDGVPAHCSNRCGWSAAATQPTKESL